MKVFAEDATLEGLGGVSKTEKGSDGSRVACAGALDAGADSKKEKSASAHASTVDSFGIAENGGGVLGRAGSGSKVLDANAEKSSSCVSLDSAILTSLETTSFASGVSCAGDVSTWTWSC